MSEYAHDAEREWTLVTPDEARSDLGVQSLSASMLIEPPPPPRADSPPTRTAAPHLDLQLDELAARFEGDLTLSASDDAASLPARSSPKLPDDDLIVWSRPSLSDAAVPDKSTPSLPSELIPALDDTDGADVTSLEGSEPQPRPPATSGGKPYLTPLIIAGAANNAPVSVPAKLVSPPATAQPTVTTIPLPRIPGLDVDALQDVLEEKLSRHLVAVDPLSRDECRKIYTVKLDDESQVILVMCLPAIPASVIESEVATMEFVRAKTSIPVPRVLHMNADASHKLGAHALYEKPPGTPLDIVFPVLSPFAQNLLVTQLASMALELAQHALPALGSLYAAPGGAFVVGSLLAAPFLARGRAALALERGPFRSAREYVLACAARERAAAAAVTGTPDGAGTLSAGYAALLADGRGAAERAAGLLARLADGCAGLDNDGEGDGEVDGDGDGAFALDMHAVSPRAVLVDRADPAKIIAITDWGGVAARPLWRCATVPRWLAGDAGGGVEGARLAAVYEGTALALGGPDAPFVRCLQAGPDTRHALDDVCDYDAVQDGFLLLPALESMAATLPGAEDVDGLRELLNPNTLAGRAARINLMTKGAGTMSLAVPAALPLDPAYSAGLGSVSARPGLLSMKSM